MRERGEKKAGGQCKTDQFAAVALRGFGLHKTILGTGAYGTELEQVIRRQGKSERGRLWNKKLRVVIANRIARAASCGRFGHHPGEGGDDVSIATADCFPLGGAKYKGYVCDGEKLEEKGKEPHTLGYFASAAKQQVRLFCLLYGEEHRDGRLDALKHLRKSHDEKPELPTAHFIVESWNRVWFEFCGSVREGIRSLLRILPDGVNREALVALALSPYGKSGKGSGGGLRCATSGQNAACGSADYCPNWKRNWNFLALVE